MRRRRIAGTAVEVVMLAGRYTLLDQSALDGVLPAVAAGHTLIVVNMGCPDTFHRGDPTSELSARAVGQGGLHPCH